MSNVFDLYAPNAERLNLIREWHQSQADQADSVAALHVNIDSGGYINVKALAIEPSHAVAMLDELKAAVARLERYAMECAPELMDRVNVGHGGNVRALYR